jgi:hypothetical protein
MKRDDIIREIESMLPDGMAGYQVAKSILKLAEKPEGTFQKVGKGGQGIRRPMSQSEAKRIVDAARARIQRADSGG